MTHIDRDGFTEELELRRHIVDLKKVLGQAGQWVGKGIEQNAYDNCAGASSAKLCLEHINALLSERV